jgi:hypothetical protein
MVYGSYNYSNCGLINQLITGGPHIVGDLLTRVANEFQLWKDFAGTGSEKSVLWGHERRLRTNEQVLP